MKCINCGAESVESTCIPCELEIRARERPPFLDSMEWVVKNDPRDDFERGMKALIQKRPQDFLARLDSLQKAYTERIKALEQVEKARRPTAPTEQAPQKDEGHERMDELIERLLKEAAS
jgi:hypothetical protein